VGRALDIGPITVTLKSGRLLTESARKRVMTAAGVCLQTLLARKNRLKLSKNGDYSIHLEMISDAKMTKLNRIFRGKDGPTDVLTFARWEVKGLPKGFVVSDLGDVVIAPAVGKRQAKRFENTYLEELQRLAVHGLLHLFGYDHEQGGKRAQEMFGLQERILKSLTKRP